MTPVNGSGERARLEKMAKLLAVAQELQDKLRAVTEELQAVLGGSPGIGPTLKHLEHVFSARWQTRYGSPYVYVYPQDAANWKRLLKRVSVEELELRIVDYIEHSDPYLLGRRHSFGLFVRNVNDYAHEKQGPSQPDLYADCQHHPPCQNRWTHGQVILAEAKGDVAGAAHLREMFARRPER